MGAVACREVDKFFAKYSANFTNCSLQQKARDVTTNPFDSKRLIYTYFGGGMLSGLNLAY